MTGHLGQYKSKSGEFYFYSAVETEDGRLNVTLVGPHDEHIADHELREGAEKTIELMERDAPLPPPASR